MKKNIALYIQGVNYLSSNIGLFKWLISIGYWLIGAKPNYKIDHPDWLNTYSVCSDDIIKVEWESDINPLSKIHAVNKLKEYINKYSKEYNIIIIGTSLGGLIAMDAIDEVNNNDIKSIILVGSINKNSRVIFNNIKILNIFSRKDRLARLAIRLLFPIRGSQELVGNNVININIAGIRHDQMFEDHKITGGFYKGKRISEVIYDVVSNS